MKAFSVGNRTGKFIWLKGESHPYHRYLFARRSFHLEESLSSAVLRVTASDRYLLYLNGRYVGRGPARSNPRLKSFDSYDVSSSLRPGRNTIAIRAYYYGSPADGRGSGTKVAYYCFGERAGLWAELEWTTRKGHRQILGTDSTWRLTAARGWDRTAKLISPITGPNEIRDANLDPDNWMHLEFDDHAWPAAEVIYFPGNSQERALPWVLLEERDVPMMREEELWPERVVEVGEVSNDGRSGIDIATLLDREIHLPADSGTIEQLDTILTPAGSLVCRAAFVPHEGGRVPYLILDFGRQVFGFPRVKFRAGKGAIIDMTHGQKLDGGRVRAIDGEYRYGDRYIARDGEQVWEHGEYKQFRYLHLTIKPTEEPVRIDSITLNQYLYPCEQRGQFRCPDHRLDKLWQAAIDTLYLQMEDNLVCDARRERIVHAPGYSVDHTSAVYVGFGALPIVSRKMRLTPLNDDGTGMMGFKFCEDFVERNFVNFFLAWSTAVRLHHLFAGCRDLLVGDPDPGGPERLYASVKRQIDWYEPHRDKNGLLGELPYRIWWDWAPLDLRGTTFSLNAHYVNGLRDAAWLAQEVGETKKAQHWRDLAEDVRTGLRRTFWDDDRGLFHDSFHEGQLTGHISEIANGFALLFGIADSEQAVRINENLTVKPTPGLIEASPLSISYLLDGLLSRGFSKKALDIMRLRFIPMCLEVERPTLWENWGPYSRGRPISDDEMFRGYQQDRFIPHGARSQAHCSPVLIAYVMTTRILGVMPTAPGFSKCSITPHPGDLEWVKGVVPTPHGDITVSWERAKNGMSLAVEVPHGIDGEVVLPREKEVPAELHHNERRVILEAAEVSAADDITLSTCKVRVGLTSGSHRLSLKRI